jgi:hypothetical protein
MNPQPVPTTRGPPRVAGNGRSTSAGRRLRSGALSPFHAGAGRSWFTPALRSSNAAKIYGLRGHDPTSASSRFPFVLRGATSTIRAPSCSGGCSSRKRRGGGALDDGRGRGLGDAVRPPPSGAQGFSAKEPGRADPPVRERGGGPAPPKFRFARTDPAGLGIGRRGMGRRSSCAMRSEQWLTVSEDLERGSDPVSPGSQPEAGDLTVS